MKSTKIQRSVTALLTIACIACFFLPERVGLTGFGLSGIFLFHFFHANWAHLALNLWGLVSYKPKFKTALVGYLCAVAAAMLPVSWAAEPTYGLSAFLFACYARTYALRRINLWKVISVQVIVGLLPHMNWRIHVISFLLSYIFWRIYYAKHRG